MDDIHVNMLRTLLMSNYHMTINKTLGGGGGGSHFGWDISILEEQHFAMEKNILNDLVIMTYFILAAKPIDLLAKYISAEDDELAIEMHEPYTYLHVSTLPYTYLHVSTWQYTYLHVSTWQYTYLHVITWQYTYLHVSS